MLQASIVERIVDTVPIGRLGQIDDQGHAQALPFVFARVAHNLWSPVDGKPKKNTRLSRLGWIAAHPEVCVLVDHYAEDWSQLWWLKLYCRAEVFHGDHVQWDAAIAALAKKYPQYAETVMLAGEPTMICFEWREWKSWCAGGDSAVEAWLAAAETAPPQ